MSEEIAGFQVSYIDRGGHYMLLEQEVKREQLIELQVQMLSTGTIPGLLPLRVDEIDFHIQLLYNISSRKMLHYALQIRKLTSKDAIDLITSMTATIGNSLNYLLHESKYVLHDRLIYVGEHWGDIWLTYVPGNIVALPSLQNQIKKLLSILVQHLQNHHEPCDDVVRLQRHCEREAWTFADFRQEVEQLLAVPYWVKEPTVNNRGVADEQQVLHHAVHQTLDQSLQQSVLHPQQEPLHQAVNQPQHQAHQASRQHQHQAEHISPNHSHQVRTELPKEEDNWKGTWWEDVEEVSSKESIFDLNLSQKAAKSIIYVILAVSIIVGAQTAMNPTKLWICMAIVVVIILATGVLLLKKQLFPNRGMIVNENYEDNQNNQGNQYNQDKEYGQTHVSIMSKINKMSIEPDPDSDLDTYYQQLGNKTSLLAPNHAMVTSLLDAKSREEFDREIQRASTSESQPMLEIKVNGRIEHKRIHNLPFVIGRDDTGVGLTVHTKGVSRIHAEVCEGSGGYVIRDLDSKNGTTLNEQELVPYESYPLSDGDMIGIVSYKIVFRSYAS